ncbi:MAG: energy transducer TonB [Myxococcales bacterium]|nr:energy transducer TonB [Myxococcales bacterium]
MFDRALSPSSSPRWKTALLLATVAGHAAVLVVLVVSAFWKIDKVAYADRTDVRFAAKIDLPPPGGPPPGARLQVERPKAVAKVKPVVPVQPVHLEVTPPVVPTTGGGAQTVGTGGGGDNVGGDPASTEIGTGTCAQPPCGETPPVTKVTPPVVKVPPPVAVPPSVAAGLRIGGNDRIYPPDRVRVEMVHGDRDQLRGTFKLCVSATGVVDSVRVMQSTGYDDYDGALVAAMQAWRYRPYKVNGVPAPMCTVEIVIYRMKS